MKPPAVFAWPTPGQSRHCGTAYTEYDLRIVEPPAVRDHRALRARWRENESCDFAAAGRRVHPDVVGGFPVEGDFEARRRYWDRCHFVRLPTIPPLLGERAGVRADVTCSRRAIYSPSYRQQLRDARRL